MLTAGRLALDAGTVEVLRAFEQAGVEALLLKGPSIARWLYAEGEPRTYIDCDLLVAPTDVLAAEEVLASLSFTRQFDDREMPSWWREHASAWSRGGDGLTVDLHRTLPGVGVDAEGVWRALSAETDVVLVARHPVPTLSLPGRALHVALHAAQHGPGWARPIADLERALAAADDDLWLEQPGCGWHHRGRSMRSYVPAGRRHSRSGSSSSRAPTGRALKRRSCGASWCLRSALSGTGIPAPLTAASLWCGPTCVGRCGSCAGHRGGWRLGGGRGGRLGAGGRAEG